MKYLIMPDSFKGTLSSREVAETIKNCIMELSPESSALAIPISDGGEGFIDCIVGAIGGEIVPVQVTGPNGKPVDSYYGRIAGQGNVADAGSGDIAVIEMAAAAGLSLAEPGSSPVDTTTYGVGELIRHAAENGCRKIIIGLGGSATNDAGAGMAAALGTKFYNKEGKTFIPVGGTLSEVCRIDTFETRRLLGGSTANATRGTTGTIKNDAHDGTADGVSDGIVIEAMCDIDNEMYGPNGAAYVFAPQKGADDAQVRLLDEKLRTFAAVIERELGVDVSGLPLQKPETEGVQTISKMINQRQQVEPLRGAGAAGAMGAGVAAFLGGRLVRGIDAILDLIDFDKLASEADFIITGEGKLDEQSLGNKAAIGIARHAKALGKPVVAVVGINELGRDEHLAAEARREGIGWVFETLGTGAQHGLASDDYFGALKLTAQQMIQTIDAL